MELAFCLYKYFPFGGLQRDFLRIAEVCQARGHSIVVYTMEWRGDVPDGFDVRFVPKEGLTNHRKYQRYYDFVQERFREKRPDLVIGFNKMPGLDVYYAADPCYEARSREEKSALYRMSPRYKHFSAYERAVFGPESKTEILMISERLQPVFMRYYGTPDNRLHMLPPGISRDRIAPPDAGEIRKAFRDEFRLGEDDKLVLMVGSGFRTKGLDRTLDALAALPKALRDHTRLYVLGDDNPRRFRGQIRRLDLEQRVEFLGGRPDLPRFLLGADLLIHPAYSENTGTVLLESIVAGLPVLATDICGYAHFVEDAKAGMLVGSPFSQQDLDHKLAYMLEAPEVASWRENGIRFAREADIYSMPERAADLVENLGARQR